MTINKNKRIQVINRSGGALGYHIPTLGVYRRWTKPGDHLNISIHELLELKTVPGGLTILRNHLLIEDEQALKILFLDETMEPEYKYGLKEVDFLLYEGTLEHLLDALDFAPTGVLDLIKNKSVNKIPNTTAKVDAINKKFSIDLNKMHELHLNKDTAVEAPEPTRRRRTAPIVETKESKQESSLPKYKVVKEDK